MCSSDLENRSFTIIRFSLCFPFSSIKHEFPLMAGVILTVLTSFLVKRKGRGRDEPEMALDGTRSARVRRGCGCRRRGLSAAGTPGQRRLVQLLPVDRSSELCFQKQSGFWKWLLE